jgi:hypothetical protein
MIARRGQGARRSCCAKFALRWALYEGRQIASLLIGDINMATAGRAPCADTCFERGITQSGRHGIPDLRSTQKGHDLAAMCDDSPTTRPWIAGQAALAIGERIARASASRRPAWRWVRPCASKFLALAAISCAVAVAGCAQNPTQREFQADPNHAAAPVQSYPEVRIRRPDRALLVPQPAPDCELKGSDLKTVDPDQWARLKLDFERQCYQRAEKVARDRLRLLQASSRCEIEPVRPSPATGSVATGPAATRPHQRRHS